MVRKLAVYCLLALLSLPIAQRELDAGPLDCMACHSAPGFREVRTDGREISLHVDSNVMASSAHARSQCVDCHVDFEGQTFPHKQRADRVDCVRCHHNGNHVGAPNASHIDLYGDSVHGKSLRSGDRDAPACKTCHGTHNIRPANDPKSSVNRASVASTCGNCHFDPGFAHRHDLASIARFKDSVHAKMVARDEGQEIAAVCTDCHGIHDIKRHGKPGSSVNRLHVPQTCGKCHKEDLKQYQESIHGQALEKGVKSAPVCTDCHGEHLITKLSSPDSPVYPTRVAQTCSKCHEDVKIQHKLGLPANRLSSYISSYHGVANKYGDVTVANCATCHGAHNVLPSSDPRSAVNKKNLPETCGKCHPGASKNFAVGSIHVIPTPTSDAVVFWVSAFYMLFVVGLIGSFCGYILLDLRARWIGRLPWRRGGGRR